MAVKSTILVLQQSFLHIFGVTQNFQLIGEGFMAQKGGDRPPAPHGYGPAYFYNITKNVFHFQSHVNKKGQAKRAVANNSNQIEMLGHIKC